MIARPETRLISTQSDLFEVILESLHRFECYYTKHELPAVERLWRWTKEGNRRVNFEPKDEEDLSDELARWLADDLVAKNIIVGREVRIEQRMKTDLLVKAISPSADGGQPPITVVVEVKGCWNPAVKEDIEKQLVQKYLLPHSWTHGIYVVGWFICDAWKSGRNCLQSSNFEEACKEVRRLGNEITARYPALTVCGLTLDCRYR
jgi:hypothetical protein